MATKTKFFRIGRTQLTAGQLGEELLERITAEQEEILEEAKDIYVAKLEELLDNLRDNSAQRGMSFYAARYNNPFEDAEIVVQKTRLGYRIRVNDKRFQYLDEGRPEQQVTHTVKFPVYTQPTATRGVSRGQPGSVVIGSPAHIIALDGPARVEVGTRFQRVRTTNAPELDEFFSDEQNQTWVTLKPGKTIAARKPRNFYLRIKKIVDEELSRNERTKALMKLGVIKSVVERR